MVILTLSAEKTSAPERCCSLCSPQMLGAPGAKQWPSGVWHPQNAHLQGRTPIYYGNMSFMTRKQLELIKVSLNEWYSRCHSWQLIADGRFWPWSNWGSFSRRNPLRQLIVTSCCVMLCFSGARGKRSGANVMQTPEVNLQLWCPEAGSDG